MFEIEPSLKFYKSRHLKIRFEFLEIPVPLRFLGASFAFQMEGLEEVFIGCW